MELTDDILKKIEEDALKQLEGILYYDSSVRELIVEFNRYDNTINVEPVEHYKCYKYDCYWDIEPSYYYKWKDGFDYFTIYGNSLESFKQDLSKLIICLPKVLFYREKGSNISYKIASFIESKNPDYYLFFLLSTKKAYWDISKDRLTSKELSDIFVEKLGNTYGYKAMRKLSSFYTELTEDEETWDGYQQEPSTQLIYKFVLDLLVKVLKQDIEKTNLAEKDLNKYKSLQEINRFLEFNREAYS